MTCYLLMLLLAVTVLLSLTGVQGWKAGVVLAGTQIVNGDFESGSARTNLPESFRLLGR